MLAIYDVYMLKAQDSRVTRYATLRQRLLRSAVPIVPGYVALLDDEEQEYTDARKVREADTDEIKAARASTAAARRGRYSARRPPRGRGAQPRDRGRSPLASPRAAADGRSSLAV